MSVNSIFLEAISWVENAGQMMLDGREHTKMTYKNHNELVTETDLKIDQYIREKIRGLSKEHRVMSEEIDQEILDFNGYVWVLDPIDGTVNYAIGIPYCAVSLALCLNGTTQLGIVHNPFLKETFTGILNQGSCLNNKSLSCIGPKNHRETIISTGFPYNKKEVPKTLERLGKILTEFSGIRRMGAAAIDICYVASGVFDGYFESVSPWDIAAATLIAKEAGANVSNITPSKSNLPKDLWSNDLIVGNPQIFEKLSKLLKE